MFIVVVISIAVFIYHIIKSEQREAAARHKHELYLVKKQIEDEKLKKYPPEAYEWFDMYHYSYGKQHKDDPR